MIKNKNKNWKNYIYNLENKFITNDDIFSSLNKFWVDIISNFKETDNFLILFKIKDVNYQYKSISNVLSFCNKDFSLFFVFIFISSVS